MSYVGGGWGEGQKVFKRETEESESGLPVQQAKIGAVALMKLTVAGIVAALIIGRGLIVFAGALASLYALALCVTFDFAKHRIYPRAPWKVRALMCLSAVGVGVFWLYLGGPLFARAVWPPVDFYNEQLWIKGEQVIPAPLWARAMALLFIGAYAAWQILLAYRMKTEMLDPNWPPVYDQRDPRLGPWNPTRANLALDEEPEIETIYEPARIVKIESHHKKGGWKKEELPVTANMMERIAKAYRRGDIKWSRRSIRSVSGVSQKIGDQLLSAMEETELLTYPAGPNDPEGGQLTRKGQRFIESLLEE